MLPIICTVDSGRREGLDFDVVLPQTQTLSRLFLNANWAHLLDPESYEDTSLVHERHLAGQRYASHHDQQRVVNVVMDIVMRNMEIERPLLAGLEWSINEITDNVLVHAQAEDGGLVQVSTYRENHLISFVVADSGRGILASLRDGFPGIRSDAEAIGEAVKQGVTRSSDVGQGNGLAGTLRMATMSRGTFAVSSGQAQLLTFTEPASGEREERVNRLPTRHGFRGTVVRVELNTDSPLRLEEALEFGGRHYEPYDIVDSLYATDEAEAVRICLAQETTGFGTRNGGEQIRTKCKNLLNAEPGKPLVLDWTGIPLVSSSFADEAVGKLFVELGPLGFSARIRNVGMEPLVRALIDRAVMQRAQATR
jgi:anti-sigma regulatory factor (Ser/Thr protein kinase)